MFLDFFYLLRERGLNVTPMDWLTLHEALHKGLAKSSLTSFYGLCKAVLIKSENDYDKFDAAFLEFFKDITELPEIPPEFYKWLDGPAKMQHQYDEEAAEVNRTYTEEDIEDMLRVRLGIQNCEHNGGCYWVGTAGMSMFGANGAYDEAGIRVRGEGSHHVAMRVAGERRFRDFTEDEVVGLRQYQVAFRKLRQFSSETDAPKTELDLDATIQATSDNAGKLKVEYRRPRQNTVKLVLLIDSGGSMDDHIALVTTLFQAVRKSNHFKDLKIYYFHNCVYQNLYTDPTCTTGKWVSTESVMHNLDGNYKLIIVGDAEMAPYELLNYRYVGSDRICSLDWFRRLRAHFSHSVWLNPSNGVSYWNNTPSRTYQILHEEFDMYLMTVKNLEQAFRKLLVNK